MSGNISHGLASRPEDSSCDETYHIDAPFLPETPIDGRMPVFREPDLVNRDPRQGLIPVPEENFPIPVESERSFGEQSLQAQRHASRIGAARPMWNYGLLVEEAVSRQGPRRAIRVDGGLPTVALLLLHMERVQLKGYVESSAFFVAQRLILFPQVAAASENPTPLWPTPRDCQTPSVRLVNSNIKVEFLWPGFQVAQVLYRLQHIASEVAKPEDADKERQWAQLLILFFIDIIDSSGPALPVFHTIWNINMWLKIRLDYAGFDALTIAFNVIGATKFEVILQVAQNVEDWVYANLLRPLTSDELRTRLPRGEISQRIMRVWTKFRNMAIQVWQHSSVRDPRGNGAHLWDLPDLSEMGRREYRPNPQRAIQDAAHRLTSSNSPVHSPTNCVKLHQQRRQSLPLTALASSSSPHSPHRQHNRRSVVLDHSRNPVSSPTSPFFPSYLNTQPEPRHAPAVFETIGGPAYSTTEIPDEFQVGRRRKRDIFFPFLKKGKGRNDGNVE